MIKKFFIINGFFVLLGLVLLSCNMKVYTLLDKATDVPKNEEVYGNKSKFNETILNTIDTNAVYEEYDTEKNILARLDPCTSCRGYLIFRFYPNGCLNMFYFKRNSTLPVKEFDPLYTGYRGVFYLENNKIRYDYFAEIDAQQHIGKISGTLSVVGDTLYVNRDDRKGLNATSYSPKIYIKRKLPAEYFVYKPGW